MNKILPVILKGWGSELWIANDENYCGKLLTINPGKMMSYHYHDIKTETFYVQSGKIMLTYGFSDDIDKANQIALCPGDSFDVPVGMRHRLCNVGDGNAEIFEFSTHHFEDDSYRIIKGD